MIAYVESLAPAVRPIAIAVLVELVEQCEAEGVETIAVADLRAAVDRWSSRP